MVGVVAADGEPGLLDRAADYLNTALEQYQLAGQQPPATLYLELALDLATAGRRAESAPILIALAKLPDAPLSALVAARVLANEYTPPRPPTTAPATQAATQAATQVAAESDQLSAKIQAQLADSIKADPDSVDALTDAIWVTLTAIPGSSPDTAAWLKTLQEKVEADDPALARLRGWQALRDGRLEEAERILAAAAPADPLAQLGLARVYIAQNKSAEAARQLQDLWWTHPTGIFALQVAQTARGARGIALTDTLSSKELLAVLQQLSGKALTAHREPRDLQLVTASFPERDFGLHDPIMLKVRINNSTGRAVPVGPDALIKTTVGLAAKSYGIDGKNMGVYAIEDLQRVYRLEARSSLEAMVRVDQGAVAELLNANPRQVFTVGVEVLTAPRGSMVDAAPGLGGQDIPVGDFQRTGQPLSTADDIQKLSANVGAATGKAQALDAQLLCYAADLLSDETARQSSQTDEPAEEAKARITLRGTVTKALMPLLQSRSPLMRAWVVLNLPVHGLDDLGDAVEAMSTDTDPVVRLAWARKMLLFAQEPGTMGSDGKKALETAAAEGGGGEQDPLVRRAVLAMLAELKEAAAKAAKPK